VKRVALTRKQVDEFVATFHRHHKPTQGDKYRLGAEHNGKLVGIVQVGRPVNRTLDDGKTLEVTRLCTDGTKNTCSFLYSSAARIARELGYKKIITYILDSECGNSLRAAGWTKEAYIRGHTWNQPGRPRKNTAPICDKQRWSKNLE